MRFRWLGLLLLGIATTLVAGVALGGPGPHPGRRVQALSRAPQQRVQPQLGSSRIFGINQASNWGLAGAALAWNLGVTSDRIGDSYVKPDQSWVDAKVAADIRMHLTPLIILDSYQRLSSIPPKALVAWMVGQARRYTAGGSFFRQYPSLDQRFAPKCFEVQNEPYGRWFFGSVEPAVYAREFIDVAKAGHRDIPGSCWLLAGGPDVNADGRGRLVAWDKAIKRAEPSLSSYADGVTVHPYGPTPTDPQWSTHPPQSWAVLGHVHHDFPSLPVWITELGYSANGGQGLPALGEQGKADKITWALRQIRRYPWVKAFYLYNLVDHDLLTDPQPTEFGVVSYRATLQASDELPAFSAYREGIVQAQAGKRAPRR